MNYSLPLLLIALVSLTGCLGPSFGTCQDGVLCGPPIEALPGAGGAAEVCVPGLQAACACPSGHGEQVCNAKGSAYEACRCPNEAQTASSAGGSAGSPTGSGAGGSAGAAGQGAAGSAGSPACVHCGVALAAIESGEPYLACPGVTEPRIQALTACACENTCKDACAPSGTCELVHPSAACQACLQAPGLSGCGPQVITCTDDT